MDHLRTGDASGQTPAAFCVSLLTRRCFAKCQRAAGTADGARGGADPDLEACVRGCELSSGAPLAKSLTASAVIRLDDRDFFARRAASASEADEARAKLLAVARGVANGCSRECALERPDRAQACNRGCAAFVEALTTD